MYKVLQNSVLRPQCSGPGHNHHPIMAVTVINQKLVQDPANISYQTHFVHRLLALSDQIHFILRNINIVEKHSIMVSKSPGCNKGLISAHLCNQSEQLCDII